MRRGKGRHYAWIIFVLFLTTVLTSLVEILIILNYLDAIFLSCREASLRPSELGIPALCQPAGVGLGPQVCKIASNQKMDAYMFLICPMYMRTDLMILDR